jgi:hypothetical protein
MKTHVPEQSCFLQIVTSLFHFFNFSRNGDALPAAMGAAAKRACRLQERRSLLSYFSFLQEAAGLEGHLRAFRLLRGHLVAP